MRQTLALLKIGLVLAQARRAARDGVNGLSDLRSVRTALGQQCGHRACAACRRGGSAGRGTAEGASDDTADGAGREPSARWSWDRCPAAPLPPLAVPVQDPGAGRWRCWPTGPGADGGGRGDPAHGDTGYSMIRTPSRGPFQYAVAGRFRTFAGRLVPTVHARVPEMGGATPDRL